MSPRSVDANDEPDIIATASETVVDSEESAPIAPLQASPPKHFFAHVLRAPIFGHFIKSDLTSYLVKPFTAKVISKIEAGKKNINTTLIVPKIKQEGVDTEGLKINTYADSSWKDNAGILFNEDCHFLGFYSADIWSSGFFGFAKGGATTPEIMSNMNDWARNNNIRYRRGNSMKITPHAATDKLQEISERRELTNPDNATTKYFDIDGNEIYTGLQNKFHKEMFDGIEKTLIPQDRLRHNETHIKTNISDVAGVFVTKNDWEDNSYKALYTLNESYLAIKQRRSEVAKNSELIAEIRNSITDRTTYYEKAINLLEAEKSEFQECLDKLQREEAIENKKMQQAFKRKKAKYPKFDSDNPENKKRWLGKHIVNAESNIAHLHEMITESNSKCNDDAIVARLKADPKMYVYDASKGLLEEVNQELVQEKIAAIPFIKRCSDVAIKPAARFAKDHALELALFSAFIIFLYAYAFKKIDSALYSSDEAVNGLASSLISLGSLIAAGAASYVLPKVGSSCYKKITDKRSSNKVHPQIQADQVPDNQSVAVDQAVTVALRSDNDKVVIEMNPSPSQSVELLQGAKKLQRDQDLQKT